MATEASVDLNNKQFKAVDNSSGLSNSDTIFTYKQNGNLISGIYIGGDIEFGNIVGSVVEQQSINLLFQCKTTSGQLLSGKSHGRVQNGTNGKLEIEFDWHWLSGIEGSGISHHIEI